MKRVGILTVFRTGNYGGTLQAYATLRAINENGFAKAEIIPYCSDAIKQRIDRRFIKKAGLFRTAVALAEKLYYFPRMRKVNAFVDGFASGRELKREELAGLNDRYDLFLSGSDQIWNPDLLMGDGSYLLDFVSDPSKKRSYGSSFGTDRISEEYRESYRRLLSEYQCITVRERAGAKLLEELLGREAEVVLDPVLLLTPEQWEARLPRGKEKRPYVFAYQMAHSARIGRIVSALCRERGVGAVFVPFPILGYCRCRPRLGYSSLEWVRAIGDSEFVVTDSFHAVVFSILFRRDFYYVITSDTVRKRLSRLETLLSALGIEDRLVDGVHACDFSRRIDYDRVHKRLDAERERSLRILKELLSDTGEEGSA